MLTFGAQKVSPKLRLRLLLTQGSYAQNIAIIKQAPPEVGITYYDGGRTYTIRIRPVGSTAAPRTIYASDKFQADAIFRRDRIYVRTNRDAPNWKLMAATYANPEFADWTTLIPEGATVMDEVAVATPFHRGSRAISNVVSMTLIPGINRWSSRPTLSPPI
mgnify:CR=1 FL=1